MFAQSFAAVLLADEKLERVRAATENLSSVAGVEARAALGQDAAVVIGPHATHSCRNALGYPLIDRVSESIVFTGANRRMLTASVHASGDGAVIEISDAVQEPRAMNLLRRFTASLELEDDPLNAVAEAVRMICESEEAIAIFGDAASSSFAQEGVPPAVSKLAAQCPLSVAYLKDAETSLVPFAGEPGSLEAPQALVLSHEPHLSEFATEMPARGAVFARCGELAVICWSRNALHATSEAVRIASLAVRFSCAALGTGR